MTVIGPVVVWLNKWNRSSSSDYGSKRARGDVLSFCTLPLTFARREHVKRLLPAYPSNGSFNAPHCIKFKNIEAPYLLPAVSCFFGQHSVNCNEMPHDHAKITGIHE
jgi:hypothetical protein